MATPLNQRPNHVFLSHSSRDKLGFVDGLYQWLTQRAGLRVWYDRNLQSGQLGANLDSAIDSSRGAVIVVSEQSVQSNWVKDECSRLHKEAMQYGGDFRIATLRLDPVDAPGLLSSYKHIDVANGALSPDAAALLMVTLFGGKENAVGRPVYLSRGWRPAERPAADRISQILQMAGLSLVCDWTDQPHYDQARVREIMVGTGGLVAILPHRGNGETSKYIVHEIEVARAEGLPVLIFAHREIALPPHWSPAPLMFDAQIEKGPIEVAAEAFANRIDDFSSEWRKGTSGGHVFLGHSLEESIDDNFLAARGMLSRITGMPVEVGGLVAGLEAQSEIVRLIREASFCVIDITNLTYQDLPAKVNFALNSCIEAGITLGAGKVLYLTCRAPRRTPPFMFRNKQVWFYGDGLELIGNLRQIAMNHRRMVL